MKFASGALRDSYLAYIKCDSTYSRVASGTFRESLLSVMQKRLSRTRLLAVVLGCAMAACSTSAHRGDQPEQERTAPPQAERPKSERPAVAARAGEQKVNTDAAILMDFKDRIDAYMKLHDRHEKGKADPKETSSPEKIKATQDELAARIQAARKDAKPGDIFTPEIRQLFRRLMYPEMKGPDAFETKQAIKLEEKTPSKGQILKVNGRYPEGSPLPTVPPNLLVRLPHLPDALEYRIVNKDLILRDVNANLIVDFIPNAIR